MITEREREIHTLLAEGKPIKQVGAITRLSKSGVRWYLNDMYTRFGVVNTTELVAFAIINNLITVQKHSKEVE